MHSIHSILVALCCILLPGWAAAQTIYKCVDDQGRPLFSQTPCAGDAQPMELDVTAPTRMQQLDSIGRSERLLDTQSQADAQRAWERAVRAQERRVRDARAQLQADVQVIQAKRARAANNLAGATWEQALAAEEQAVVMRHQPTIEAAQRELERLRENRP